MASCKRAPFDLAEAESELVAGFHTEYSGFRWLVIFMAEYGSMFAVSGIACIMFLGGWSIGIPWELTTLLSDLGVAGLVIANVVNVAVFLFKGWLLVFVMMWVRWTLPRLRIDQVMMLCFKYLIPISCVLLAGVSLWRMLVPAMVQEYVSYAICALSFGGVGYVVTQLLTWASLPPGSAMPGMWRTMGLPGYQGQVK
jgi:NADH-quinone oxidoreductase subunit H